MTETSRDDVDPLDPASLDAALTDDPGFAASSSSIAAFVSVHKSDLPAWSRVQAVLRKHHQLQQVKSAVSAAAREERSTLSLVAPGEGPKLVPVCGVVKDAPVSADAVIPPGWRLTDERDCLPSLVRVVTMGDDSVKHVPVLSRPAVITSWITNETTHAKALEVAWKSLGKWRRTIVDLKKMCDATKIVDALAGHGFPVHSNNRCDVVQWFADYLNANVREIPVRGVTEQMGWADDTTFVCGRKGISALGSEIEFVGADGGDDQLADAIGKGGDPEEWRRAVNGLDPFPRVRLALCASLAVPLLNIVHCPNFAVDFAYRTSSGKTSALKVAASVWGNPDERAPNTMVGSWMATRNWIERAAAARSDLPLILDDTKRAGTVFGGKSVVPGVVYDVTNGEGKGRGSIAGTQVVRHWRTILLSSGEHRMIDESKDAGTAARVVTVWGNPWGGESIKIAGIIANIVKGIEENFGHAGPDWIRWIVSNRDEWPAWRAAWERHCEQYAATLSAKLGASVGSRFGKYLAILKLAEELAHDADGVWLNMAPDAVDRCLEEISDGPKDTDRAHEALKLVCDWAASNRGRFYDGNSTAESPPGGWLGRWDTDKPSDEGGPWAFLGVVRHELTKILTANGHEPESIIRLWHERGWLAPSADKATVRRVRLDCGRAHVVAVDRSAVDWVFDQSVPRQMGLSPASGGQL